jgi:hypothetical protein
VKQVELERIEGVRGGGPLSSYDKVDKRDNQLFVLPPLFHNHQNDNFNCTVGLWTIVIPKNDIFKLHLEPHSSRLPLSVHLIYNFSVNSIALKSQDCQEYPLLPTSYGFERTAGGGNLNGWHDG